MKKMRSMHLVACIILLLFLVNPVVKAQSGEETILDIAQGSITISATGASGGGLLSAETGLNPAGYVIIQSGIGATANTITINSGVSAEITLSGINISSSAAALKIGDNSTGNVTLIIADGTENFLQSGNGHAGIEKNSVVSSGILTISGGQLGTGTLDSRGDPGNINSQVYGGAGIGGAKHNSTANIIIKDTVITAVGGHWAAGIGGGLSGSGSNISIMDSTVRATTGTEGAGIGGGSSGTGSNIIIAGSSVYAAAGWDANNIGGGRFRSAVVPTSDGATLVYRTDVTLSDVTSTITDVKAVYNIEVDGLSGVYTDKTLYTTSTGTLYLWLPAETAVKSLTADNSLYTGTVNSATSGILPLETVKLDLGDGLIRIYPDKFFQNDVEYPFSGKYEITGSYRADTPLRILNDTDTPVVYDITLDSALIYGDTWCTAVRIDNTAPDQSENPENLIVNLHAKGNVYISGHNHPGLQAGGKSIVNLSGAEGSHFTCTQFYYNSAVSSNITLNLDAVCALVKVNSQQVDITAAYQQKPLSVTFYDEHTPGDEATCTTAQVCTVCGVKLVPALGHTPGEWIVEIEATCTEQGLRHLACAICDEQYLTEAVLALGHSPGDGATCATAQVCTACGVELVPALGHSPGDEATCTTAQVCTVCGAELVPALGHSPGDEATCTAAQVCTVCGAELVPMLEHDYVNGVCTVCKEIDADYTQIPKTGESSRFTFVLLLCIAVLIVLYKVRRKICSAD